MLKRPITDIPGFDKLMANPPTMDRNGINHALCMDSSKKKVAPKALCPKNGASRGSVSSGHGDLIADAFQEACSVEHTSRTMCFAAQYALPAITNIEQLRSGLAALECEQCWTAIVDRALFGQTAKPAPCRAHLSAIVPMCSFCCIAYFGYHAIDELILVGCANNIIALRFAFLGACVACDNMRALRIYLRYVQVLHVLPASAQRTMILNLLRDGVHVLCTSSAPASVVVEFLIHCYFPRVPVDGYTIWHELDFIGYFEGTSRTDILDYIYDTPEGKILNPHDKWIAHGPLY